MSEKIISANIIRALQKLKKDPGMASMLVDPDYMEEFNQLFDVSETKSLDEFSLKTEFVETYKILKTMLQELALSSEKTTDDLKILNSAQKFLEFILKNEATLNGIDSVKNFKEAVFTILDEASPELRDTVITKLNELVEA
jgi:hypothetical protein